MRQSAFFPILLFWAILFCPPSALSAQDHDVDALKEALDNKEGEERFPYLFQLGVIEREARHFKRSIGYLEEALELARSLDDEERELKSLELLASVYQRRGWQKKKVETELAYRILKGKVDERNRSRLINQFNSELDSLDTELDLSEQEKMALEVEKEGILYEKEDIASRNRAIQRKLSVSERERLQKERELERMARIRAELKQQAEHLMVEAYQDSLAILEKEQENADLENELRRQRLKQSLMAAFLVIVLLISLFLWYALRERRRRTEERMVLQKQLMMQEKLASLGQLTAGIAHEIKNPLNFVNNFAEGSSEMTDELSETLEENRDRFPPEDFGEMQELAGELKQNAQDIIANGQRMDRIIHSMMEHARGEKGESSPADINLLVDDAINLSYHGFRALDPTFNITIERDFSEGLPVMKVVGQDISRVLLNLLNNACHALNQMKKDKGERFDPILRVTTRQVLDGVEIQIQDNGPGIPPELQDRIFTPFFTTKPTGEGNIGLGLSISRDIVVEGHGGEIRLDSKVGAYTCFTVFLPEHVPAAG